MSKINVTPVDPPGDTIEYPSGTRAWLDPSEYEPGVEQFLVVDAVGEAGEVRYGMWSHWFEMLPDDPPPADPPVDPDDPQRVD